MRIDELDRAIDSVANVHLAQNRGLPFRRMRILEIGHVNLGSGIQRIDDHFAVHRAGDFHAPVLQVLRNGGYSPGIPAKLLGFRKKIRQYAGIDFRLLLRSSLKQGFALCGEFPHQLRNKTHRIRGQDFRHLRGDGPSNLDPFRL